MTLALLACFPVCLTFAAMAILALLILVTGMFGPGASADPNDSSPAAPDYWAAGPPAWWVVVFIFIAVAMVFLSLHWIGAD